MGANARFKLLEARKLDTPTLPRQKHIERSGEKLDINSTPCISNFIKKSTGIFKRGPDVTSNGKTYPTWYDGKFRYMDEDNHWDIQYPAPAYCTKPAPQGCGRKPLRHPEPACLSPPDPVKGVKWPAGASSYCSKQTVGCQCRGACDTAAGYEPGSVTVTCLGPGWGPLEGSCKKVCKTRPTLTIPEASITWPDNCAGRKPGFQCLASGRCKNSGKYMPFAAECGDEGSWVLVSGQDACSEAPVKSCVAPPPLIPGIVSYPFECQTGPFKEWDRCGAECNEPGYKGVVDLVCTWDGTWERDEHAGSSGCRKVCGPLPPAALNALPWPTVCEELAEGDECWADCDRERGYDYWRPTPPPTLLCKDGQWMEQGGECRFIGCEGPPPSLPHVTWTEGCTNAPAANYFQGAPPCIGKCDDPDMHDTRAYCYLNNNSLVGAWDVPKDYCQVCLCYDSECTRRNTSPEAHCLCWSTNNLRENASGQFDCEALMDNYEGLVCKQIYNYPSWWDSGSCPTGF